MAYYVVAWESGEAKGSGTILGPFTTREDAKWNVEAMSGWADSSIIVRASDRKQALNSAQRHSGEPIEIANKRMRESLGLV